jgi:hypothetical protein
MSAVISLRQDPRMMIIPAFVPDDTMRPGIARRGRKPQA